MARDRHAHGPAHRRGVALTGPKRMTKLRVLVLAAGTRVGQNILTTLAWRRTEMTLIAVTSIADEPGPFDYDVVHLVPPTASPDFEAQLLSLLESERIDLVIPCRDDDVLFLAALRDRSPSLAPRLLCGSAAAALAIVDKGDSARFAVGHDLPFAPSLVAPADAGARTAFVRAHGFPLVAKPRRGYASMGVHLISNDAQLARALERDGTLVQKFLGDPETLLRYLAAVERDGVPLFHTFQGLKHSIQALIAQDGTIAHVICLRTMSDRRRSKVVVPDAGGEAPALGERCAAAFAAAGWRGPLNIQCQRDANGRLSIHEFNGRFTGATVERWRLGHDEVAAAIASFTGRALAPYAITPEVAPREVFETVETRGTDPRHAAALARDGVWHRMP